MIFLILNMKQLNLKIYRKYFFLRNSMKKKKRNNSCYRKVVLLEDEDQNMHLKNLSIHAAQNEEEALNLLFLGDTNRMIAEVNFFQKPKNSRFIKYTFSPYRHL